MKRSKIFIIVVLMVSIFGLVSVNGFINIRELATATVAATSIKISNSPNNIEVGRSEVLKYVITPTNSSDSKVTWSSSNEKILKVSDKGVITGVSEGSAKITVKTSNGKKDSVIIKVSNGSLSGINTGKKSNSNIDYNSNFTIKNMPDYILLNEKLKLEASEECTWSSGDKSVATISDNGEVVAQNVGVVTIIAKNRNGKTISKTLNVINVVADDSSIKLDLNNTSSSNVSIRVIVPASFDISKINKRWANTSTKIYKISKKSNFYVKKNINNQACVEHNYVAQVDAKSKGKAYIKFSFGKAQVKKQIEVIEGKSTLKLLCPVINYQYTNGEISKITVVPSKKTVSWTYYYSTGKTGSNANWQMGSTLKGKQELNINDKISQNKIVVRDEKNNSKVCYTVPYKYSPSTTRNNITYSKSVKCPNITEKIESTTGTRRDINLNGNNKKYYTGVGKISFTNPAEKYDENNYSWYFSNGGKNNATWLNNGASYGSSKTTTITISPSSDLNGKLVIIDKNGDIKACPTNTYSSIVYDEVMKKDGTEIYFEKGFSQKNTEKELINKLDNVYFSGATSIYFLTKKTYENYWGTGSQGMCSGGHVYEKDWDGKSDYKLFSLVHELGHSLDNVYSSTRLGNKSGNITSQKGDNSANIPSTKSLHDKLINEKNSPKCNGYNYLRGYSYSKNFKYADGRDYKEFWADIIKYTYMNKLGLTSSKDYCNVNNEIINFKDYYMNKFIKDYNGKNSKLKKYKSNYVSM